MRSKRVWLGSAVCAVTGLAALSEYLHWTRTTTYSWIMLAAAAGFAAAGAVWFAQPDQRSRRFGLVFGMLFVLVQVCGSRITHIDTIAQNGFDFWLLAVGTAALSPAAGGVFSLFVQAVARMQKRSTPAGRLHPRTVFWGSIAILLLCWLPYLLAFYPGLFTYDISWQYEQYQKWNLNTHHPLLHTLMVGWFCDLGWHLFGYPSKGLLMYTLFQMTLMALAMASAIRLLYKQRAPTWICAILLTADAVLPFNTLLVISSTKDTLFAGAVMYLCVVLLEMVLDKEALHRHGWMIRFVLTQAAVALMRNNGFICIIAVLFVAAVGIVRRRRLAERLAALALCGLITYSAVSSVLQTAADAEEGHFREMLSVPLQQMARVYMLTEDEAKPEIKKWLPTVEQYSPQLADMVKNTFDAEKEQLPEVFRLWMEVGLRNPVVYLDSMLITSAGFYYIDAMPTGQYLETSFHTDEGRWMVDDSKWPELRGLMARLYSSNEFLEIPFFNIILSPALWVWLMLLCVWAALCTRSWHVALAGLAPAALYLTTLLSPCVMARYVYPFMLCAPLLLGGLLIPDRKA